MRLKIHLQVLSIDAFLLCDGVSYIYPAVYHIYLILLTLALDQRRLILTFYVIVIIIAFKPTRVNKTFLESAVTTVN